MKKIKGWLDSQYKKELMFEYEKMGVSEAGVVDRVYLHIAHLRMLSKMAAAIMFGQFGLIIVLYIILIKKGIW